MLQWLNMGVSLLQNNSDGSKILALLNRLGIKYRFLPLMIQQELKNPHSLLAREFWVTYWYFSIKEILAKLIIGNLIMKLYLTKLAEEYDFLISTMEAELAKLQHFLKETDDVELKEELSFKIHQQQTIILQLKKIIYELNELIEIRTKKVEQLNQVVMQLETLAINRRQSIMDCIDRIYDLLDQRRIAHINQVQDPKERAYLLQEQRNRQVERKVAKQWAEKYPEVFRKSCLVVTRGDESMKDCIQDYVKFAAGTKLVEKKEIEDAFTQAVKPFDSQMEVLQQKVRELKNEIVTVDEEIAQKTKEAVELNTKLNPPTVSEQMDAEMFRQKAQSILDEVDNFSTVHSEDLMDHSNANDLLTSIRREVTDLMENKGLSLVQRFSFLCSFINKLSKEKQNTSLSPDFTNLLQELCVSLKEKVYPTSSCITS